MRALRTCLGQGDSALAEGRYGAARSALDALVRETVTARDTGRLPAARADRILGAATRLSADLPAAAPARTSAAGAGPGSARTPTVESDAYITLAVDWVPIGCSRSVHYRVPGRSGGDGEVELEPTTGEIIGLVVIEQPTDHVAMPIGPPGQRGSVRVDLGPWQARFEGALAPVVHDEQPLALAEGGKCCPLLQFAP